MKLGFCCLSVLFLASCASAPPTQTGNICSIFREKTEWYASSRASASRWSAPIAVQIAIINQESSFVENARPPRQRFLGIPLWRPTTAYGYGQATDATWDWYIKSTGNSGADRDDFADVVDFVGWYMHQTTLILGVGNNDAYNHYLAYHEGQGGFKRGSWRAKGWLQRVARQVEASALRYQRQLNDCRPALDRAISS
jgi:hypothetical protein